MSRRVAHFLALGAMLFVAERAVAPDAGGSAPEPRGRIVVETARVEALRERHTRETGAAPDPSTLAALVEAAVDEEVLVRTALALGLHERDPLVRDRLARNMRFVGSDEAAPEAALVRDALSLGMERTDPIVRRRLAFQVERMLRDAGRAAEPTDEVIRAHVRANPAAYHEPPRVSFTHRFFSQRLRGEAAGPDARGASRRLRAGDGARLVAVGSGGDAAVAAGDPPLFAERYDLVTSRDLARRLGEAFANAVFTQPVGQWSPPIWSPYGAHVVRVEERPDPAPQPFARIRARARRELLREREEAARTEGIRRLRAQYEIQVAAPISGGGA